MKKLNFAIVGCGNIAQRHAKHIANYGKLVAVCDIEYHKAILLAKKYKCKSFHYTHKLLKEKNIDVIAICSPNANHYLHTVSALKAGKHVICEKPMAITSRTCKLMIKAAHEHNKKLFIVKQNRFNPPVIALKKAIDKGYLGDIFNIHLNCHWNRDESYYKQSDWKGSQEIDGGTLFTQFSHFIDLMYWINGDIVNAISIRANFDHPMIEFEDTGAVIFEFKNGSIGSINFTIGSYDKNMEGSITVFGKKGTVKIGGQYLNTLEYQNIKDYKIINVEESRPANNYGHYTGSMSNHDKIYENVIDVLENNSKIATTGYEGMKVVEIIEKIYRNPDGASRFN